MVTVVISGQIMNQLDLIHSSRDEVATYEIRLVINLYSVLLIGI